MPTKPPQSVSEYLAAQPIAARAVLKRVRAAIRRALPKAEEVISYQIPTYKLGGTLVLCFAGWKAHYSLYPATDDVIAAVGDDLPPGAIQKRTLRFSLDEPVPLQLIERIARRRAREMAHRAKVKAARAKPRQRTTAVRR